MNNLLTIFAAVAFFVFCVAWVTVLPTVGLFHMLGWL